jgi:hypothetical protein
MIKPVRVQRSRRKGSTLASPNGLPVVCVTRPGDFGNPFTVTRMKPGTEFAAIVEIDGKAYLGKTVAVPSLEDSLDCFRMYVEKRLEIEPHWLDPLRGRNLACWCKLSDRCHADILLEIVNR